VRGWTRVADFPEVASGKSAEGRERLQEALSMVRGGDAGTLMVTKLDRLCRSVLDFAMTTADAGKLGWNLVMLEPAVDLSTPHGEMMANIMASVAQWERRIIGQRTSEALRALQAGLPTFGTLILLWVFESARTAARARRGVAEERRQREARERELTRVRTERAAAETAALTQSPDPVPQADPDPAPDPAPAPDPVPVARVKTRSSRRSDPVQPPVKVGIPETVTVALAHRAKEGELPGQAALARLAGTSESTAKRALKEIRETPQIHLVKSTG
jgi:DNA invertase Pin-like site-specific DNA recombinase